MYLYQDGDELLTAFFLRKIDTIFGFIPDK